MPDAARPPAADPDDVSAVGLTALRRPGSATASMILLNPGPVNVSARVTAALARGDLCHREPEAYELLARIRERLGRAFAPRGGFTRG